jgi:hypothetical protein
MRMSELTNPKFREVLAKLLQAPLALKVAYKLHNINKITAEEYEKYEKLRIQAVQKWCMRKEDGTLDVDDNGNAKFTDEGRIGFAEDMTQLINIEFEAAKISFEDLGDKVQLSATELAAIEGILDV